MPASLQELTERLDALQKQLEPYGIVVPKEGEEPSEGGLQIPSFDAIRQALELSGDAPLRLSVQNDGTQLNRQRTLNFTPPLVATESSANKRIDLTITGLGSGVHALGTKIASGIRVEYRRVSHSHTGGQTNGTGVTFANAFTGTPFVVAMVESGAGTGSMLDLYSISNTGFTGRHSNTATETDYIQYIAIGS